MIDQWTPELGRSVQLRPDTCDLETWQVTFGEAFHVPPAEMPEPNVVLDLGANIGLTAAHYAELWPDALVWMVEPQPDNLHVAMLNAPRCPPLMAAVAPEPGYRWLAEAGVRADSYALVDTHVGSREVYAMGMRQLVDVVGGGDGIDFCKMDIEGMEWGLLNQLAGVRHLLVEFHDTSGPTQPGLDQATLLEQGIEALEAQGFVARHHPPHPLAVWAVA